MVRRAFLPHLQFMRSIRLACTSARRRVFLIRLLPLFLSRSSLRLLLWLLRLLDLSRSLLRLLRWLLRRLDLVPRRRQLLVRAPAHPLLRLRLRSLLCLLGLFARNF